MMKINVENLGYIDKGSVELGELTVICGPNNVGKTYLSTAIYSFLDSFKHLSNIELPSDFKDSFLRDKRYTLDLTDFDTSQFISSYLRVFNNSLSNYFAGVPGLFNKTNITLDIEEDGFNFNKALNDFITITDGARVYINKEAESSKLTIDLIAIKDIDLEDSISIIAQFFRDAVSYLLIDSLFPTPFSISSERTGVSVFQQEIDNKKIALLDTIAALQNNEKASEIFSKVKITYSKPIGDNLEILRNYKSLSKKQSFISKDISLKYILDSMYDLIGGECKYINHEIVFIPKPEPGREQVLIPLNLASSSVKSLVLLELYIKSLANENDLVLIDEPELNLHPNNQRKIAGLLSQLVNAGVKVLITTHSDYIIRELNNRIQLNSLSKMKQESILDSYNIDRHELLKPAQVQAYCIQNDHLIHQAKISELGIELEIFDEVISDSSILAEEIFYARED